jgi:hypothetical protein
MYVAKTENFTLYFWRPIFKPITLKLAKWFTGSTKTRKEDSSDTTCDSASDIFDYGFCDLIENKTKKLRSQIRSFFCYILKILI